MLSVAVVATLLASSVFSVIVVVGSVVEVFLPNAKGRKDLRLLTSTDLDLSAVSSSPENGSSESSAACFDVSPLKAIPLPVKEQFLIN
jgi:hypothetical protein